MSIDRDVAPPLADASASWLATVASGLASFAVAAAASIALTLLDEPLVRPTLAGLLRHDDADVALGVAMLHDGATLLAALGLVLLARRDVNVGASRRGAWLAIALLVATCVGEHVVIATTTLVSRYLRFGPAGEPVWRAVALDGRHLAWSIAIAVALRRVADLCSSHRTRLLSFAWPVLAAVVVVLLRGDDAMRLILLPLNIPLLLALVVEVGFVLATLAVVLRFQRRLIAAWRVARRRIEAAPDDRPADACIRCGYDLRGIAADAACPECGLLAGRSRTTAASHLRDAPPAWLRGISIGVSLVLLAEVLGAAWPFVFNGIVLPNISWNGAASPGYVLFGVGVDLNLLLHVPAFACAAILFVGVWLLTRPQRADARDDVLRGVLRTFAIVPLAAFAITLWNNRNALTGRPSTAMNFAAIALLTAGCAPIPALMFALLRRLARRVLNANLAEHSTIVGVGLAITLLAIPPVAIVLGQLDIGRSDTSMFLLLAVMVAFVLFAGWSAVNCVRFALAFRRAEREARALWTDADRAT